VHDLVIRGGLIVDGTGHTPYEADLAVSGGLITEIGRVEGHARRVLEAAGLTITPGFIDIHTHYDGQATWDPHLTPSCWHGVTTAVLGNCGVGFAPAGSDAHERLIQVMEGVEDIPGTALSEGMTWGWETFGEYLDVLDAMPRALNVAPMVPHAALRDYVMGVGAHGNATREEVAIMAALLGDALRAGAVGFSTGRTAGHRDVRGQHVPGTFAPESELTALLEVMVQESRGVLQIVPAGVSNEIGGDPTGAMDSELDLILRAGLEHDRPITFLAMESSRDPHQWKAWFERVRLANQQGAKIHPQVACRSFGVLMGLQSRMNPLRHRASYAEVAHLPLAERVRRLSDPDLRARILADEPDMSGGFSMDHLGSRIFKNLYPLGESLDYEPTADMSVAALAEQGGRDPWEVVYDVLLASEGREFLLFPLLNYGEGSYQGLYEMMSDPNTVQGLGDGGAHVGLICDASMTTYLLSHWVRDRSRGPRLPIQTAVKRLTADPAALYEMNDRGLLKKGYRADINVIDLPSLALIHPERIEDLPAGAGRLIQRSTGYVETIVAGETIVADGVLTNARPGRVVRGPQAVY
jgi:N-acyl-D-amino-acid deacylase